MLLPDPRRRGEIKFSIAKSMPYNTRLVSIILILVTGFLVQILLNRFILGIPMGAMLLLAASLLGVVKGYTNIPEKQSNKKEWRAGDKEQLEKIVAVSNKTKTWDQSMIDITCGRGFLMLLAVAVFFAILFIILCGCGYPLLGFLVVVDGVVLLFPHWVTGVRRILTNDKLVVKVQNLLYVYSIWEKMKDKDEAMNVQIEIAKAEKGEIPTDAKLILQKPSLGSSFYGLQIQVVLNNVQGNDFPYLYCVLVAKNEFGMREKIESSKSAEPPEKPASFLISLISIPVPKITTEWKDEGEMDIVVMRQETSKTSGYHTDTKAVERIFQFALAKMRILSKE